MANTASAAQGGGGIPIIDLSPWTQPGQHSDDERQATVDAVEQACREIGFFAITGHARSTAAIKEAWSETTAFFDLPADEKLKSKTPANVAEYPYGYEQSERLSVGKKHGSSNSSSSSSDLPSSNSSAPDLKETFSIGPSNPASGMPARRWPKQPPNFATALSTYYREMEQLAQILLQIFAVALKLPSPHWFADKTDHHMSALRVLNYYPVNRKSAVVANHNGAASIRASAHTDYGALTILKSGGPGLQVQKDNIDNEQDEQCWINVPTLEDAFVINIGDMMQRWTNGAYNM